MYAIKVFHGFDLIITNIFLFVVLLYVVTTLLLLILPSLHSMPRLLKISLLILTVIGGCALILKYVLEYSAFAVLAITIVYAGTYAVALLFIRKNKRRINELLKKTVKEKKYRSNDIDYEESMF